MAEPHALPHGAARRVTAAAPRIHRAVPAFPATVSALSYSIIRERCNGPVAPDDRHNRIVRFVLAQHAAMPDYLYVPFAVLTLIFDAVAIVMTGRRFHRLPHGARWRFVTAWQRLPVSFARDLIRFYESLVVFSWFAVESGGDLA